MTISKGIWTSLLRSIYAAAAIMATTTAVFPQAFVSQGPGYSIGPVSDVQSADKSPSMGTVSGAVQALVLDPALGANTMFIGSPNGGIWKTTNGGASWTTSTANASSLSIASLGVDVTVPTGRTLIAGLGTTSNGGWGLTTNSNGFLVPRRGNPTTGLLYSNDGGSNWTNLQGTAAFAGQSVIGVAARGKVVLAATFEESDPAATFGKSSPYGLYRSDNTGQNFSLVTNGLPAGPVTALVADPNNANTFYASVTSPANPKATGIYKSTDAGASWTPVFTQATAISNGGANLIASAQTQLVPKLATGPNGSVAIALSNYNPTSGTGQLQALYLTQNQGGAWTQLKAPSVNSGGQGIVNLAIAIDPRNTGVIYVAGDGTGVNNFTLSAFRVDRNGSTSLTEQYAGGTTAHADARTLLVNPAGNLLMGGDGGVYFRTSPLSNYGTWQGLNSSTLNIRETYAAAYGANAHRLAVASQDTGVGIQSAPNSVVYNAVQGGDGVIAVVNDNLFAGKSVFYISSQFLGLSRVIVDGQGNRLNADVTCDKMACGCDPANTECTTSVNGAIFSSPFALNKANQALIALAGTTIFTTQDMAAQSSSSFDLVLNPVANSSAKYAYSTLIYGTTADMNLILAGNSQGLFFRNTATPALNKITTYEGNEPTSLVFDQRFENRFYVADGVQVYGSTPATVKDKISSKTPISTLPVPASIDLPSAVEFINNDKNGVNALLVGGLSNNGTSPIAVADSKLDGSLVNWRLFGSGLPNVLIWQMSYNQAADVLALATVGGGAWMLYDVSSYFPQALVLRFGGQNNDSQPDASFLTDRKDVGSETTERRSLVKDGAGTLTIAGAASYTGSTTVNGGVLNVTGSIVSPVTVYSSATLTGNGAVGATTINTGGSIIPGLASIGTLTVNGNYAQYSGSTLSITASSVGTNNLNVTGAASLDGSLQVQLAPLTSPVKSGVTYPIVTASAVSGTFSSVTTKLSTFISAETGYTPSVAELTLIRSASYASVARSANQRAFANSLTAGLNVANLTPDMNGILGALDGVQNPAEARRFYDQADADGGQNDVVGNQLLANLATNRIVEGALDRHLEVMSDEPALEARRAAGLHVLSFDYGRMTGFAVDPSVDTASAGGAPLPTEKGPAAELNYRGWGEAIGARQNLGGDGNAYGLSQSIGGFVGGVDGNPLGGWNPTFKGGVAFSYLHGSLGGGSETGLTNAYTGYVYATQPLGRAYVEGRAGFGMTQMSTVRQITALDLYRSAYGSTSGNDWSAALGAGYRFSHGLFDFEPSVHIAWDEVGRRAYNETGAGALNLAIDNSALNALQFSAGVRIDGNFALGGGFVAQPEVRVRYAYDALNLVPATTASLMGLPGIPFTVAGVNIGRNAAVLGASLTVARRDYGALFVDYNAELRQHETVQTVMGGVRIAW